MRVVGRPRDDAATVSLLTATLTVVAKRGYHEASLDEIVARAGSSKPTIYRRYRGKPALVAAAIRHALATANPRVPESGDARRDVRVVLRNTLAMFASSPLARVVATLIGAADEEPELAVALAHVERERRALLLAAVRPLSGDDARAELDVDMLLGAIYFRVLFRRMTPKKAFAGELVAARFPR